MRQDLPERFDALLAELAESVEPLSGDDLQKAHTLGAVIQRASDQLFELAAEAGILASND